MEIWQWVYKFLLVALFLFVNAFFVAAEFALVKVRSTQIETLLRRGNRQAAVVKDILAHLNTYLSAIQLGITMTSLALGWIGEPYVSAVIRPMLNVWGILSEQVVHTISIVVGFSIITALHITIGELVPKTLAILKPKETSLAVAWPMKVFFIVFRPAIRFLDKTANGILLLMGVGMPAGGELEHSAEELRLLLKRRRGVSAASKDLVLNAFDFRTKQAKHIMIPPREIVALNINDPVRENIAIMRRHKYSRYPVYKETIDNIIGIIHTKDIFKHEKHLRPDFALESVLRDAVFLPETVTLDKALETMLMKKSHMVVLGDEYGSTAGIVTMENVLEEIVGTIQDEFDRETPEVVKISDNEFLIDAAMTTNEVEQLLERELSVRDILSIGGFILERLEHIPEPGEKVTVPGAEFTVEKVAENTVELVRVKKIPLPAPAEE